MKIILILFLFLNIDLHTSENKEVYLCGDKGSGKYHLVDNCRGLSACKHEIVKKKLSEAKNLGLTLCGWED